MVCRLKLLRLAEYFLQLYHAPVLELNDLPAFRADHVIVMRAANSFLVLRVSLTESVPRNDAALVQQIKRIIYRCTRNLAAMRLQVQEERVCFEMTFPPKHAIQHFYPLRRYTQSAALNKFHKMFSRFLFVHFFLLRLNPNKNKDFIFICKALPTEDVIS
jgi:hypothetical protein